MSTPMIAASAFVAFVLFVLGMLCIEPDKATPLGVIFMFISGLLLGAILMTVYK